MDDELKWDLLCKMCRDRRLTVTEMRAAIHLLTDDTGVPWPRLAELSGATVPDVQRAGKRLAMFGYLPTADAIGASVH
jgi:hypothetical protein